MVGPWGEGRGEKGYAQLCQDQGGQKGQGSGQIPVRQEAGHCGLTSEEIPVNLQSPSSTGCASWGRQLRGIGTCPAHRRRVGDVIGKPVTWPKSEAWASHLKGRFLSNQKFNVIL